jgi:shikimate dehydrogenase
MIYKLGLIGYPLSHSLSPKMHSAALRALSLAGTYEAIPIPADELHTMLPALVAQGYQGLNVTIPHKQAVLPFMRELSDAARAIGAVNTIVIEDSRLIGYNTDAIGFMRALTEAGFEANGKTALVLGAGGAARAVVYVLTQAGAHVTIWNRTGERATQLAREFNAQALGRLPTHGDYDLLVNTTAVGMTPHHAETPVRLSHNSVHVRGVYDLVYNPRDTVLLREARAIGAQAIGGLAMLIYQGAEAFKLWTGHAAPIEVMRAAIEEDK